MKIRGFEIDRDNADFSAGIHNGRIEIGIGEEYSNCNGYVRYLGFTLDKEEAKALSDWLGQAVKEMT